MVSKSITGFVEIKEDLGARDARETVDIQVTAVGQADRSMNLEAESAIDVATLFVGCKITEERRILGRSIEIARRTAGWLGFANQGHVAIVAVAVQANTSPIAGRAGCGTVVIRIAERPAEEIDTGGGRVIGQRCQDDAGTAATDVERTTDAIIDIQQRAVGREARILAQSV